MDHLSNRNLAAARAAPEVEHGGPNGEELRSLGIEAANLLDFSVCTNPFGPSPRVYDALRCTRLEQYPDRECQALRAVLAERFEISPQRILAGNGVSELIWLTALAFLRPGDHVLVLGPTYGEYQRAASLQGALISKCDASAAEDFTAPRQRIETELHRGKPRLAFLCNPNNPTGTILEPELILALARQHPATIFVVDEAYQAFAPGLRSLVGKPRGEVLRTPGMAVSNLLVLRSMTKDYALAGLRIGYAVGGAEIIGALACVRPPWSVSSLAQAAALAALGDEQHLAATLADLSQATRTLTAALCALDRSGIRKNSDAAPLRMELVPSATHFFLARVGNGAAFRRTLLGRGILVRDAASFGLPAFVRLATRRPDDNDRLLAALREVCR